MSYSGSPSDSNLDEVRFLLGDTDESNELLSDDEVEYLLNEHGTPIKASYHGALTLAAQYAGKADVAIGTARITYAGISDRFVALAKSFADRGGAIGVSSVSVGAPWAGNTDTPLTMTAEWHNVGEEEL